MNVDNSEQKYKELLKLLYFRKPLCLSVWFAAQFLQLRTLRVASVTLPCPKYISWTIIKGLTQTEELWGLEMETDLALHSQDNST